MRFSRVSLMLVAGVLAAIGPAVSAQSRPDFSGSWITDPEKSKALTESKGLEWRVAGAGSGGASAGNAGTSTRVLRQIYLYTQSATELVIESRWQDQTEISSRDVYKLDGTESVNASRTSTTRSRTVWKGNALVTTGTTHIDLTGDIRATDANGNPMTEINRSFTTTRMLMPDGTMQIETRSVQSGRPDRHSWTVMVPVKN